MKKGKVQYITDKMIFFGWLVIRYGHSIWVMSNRSLFFIVFVFCHAEKIDLVSVKMLLALTFFLEELVSHQFTFYRK